MYSSSDTRPSRSEVSNLSNFAIRSLYSGSKCRPSFSTVPKPFQKSRYTSGWSLASSSSASKLWLITCLRMIFTALESCSTSRETLRGRSSESITPRTKRSQRGTSSSQLSMTNTRLTCKRTP